VSGTEPRLLIVGGATAESAMPLWEGYRCVCMPRSRVSFCDLRQGVWTVRIEPRMLEAFVDEAATYDAVFCETSEALLLVTEWSRRDIPPRPILALEVDGIEPVRAFGGWYAATRGIDPVPELLRTPWVSWIATSEEQATRLEAAGIEPRFLHRVPTGASLFSMLSTRAGAQLAGEAPAWLGVEPTADTVLFPGIGRRDWPAIVDAVLGMPDLTCSIVGGSRSALERLLAARRKRWPANLRHFGFVPLERYIEMIRVARVAVVPLLPGLGDGGHSTIALVHRLGVPLVCTDSPALVEYVDEGRAALRCPAGDPRGLVHAVRTVVSDADLRRRLVDGGHRAELQRDAEFRRSLPAAIARARECLPQAPLRAPG
jgi:glycosyltransferase involved in cell wall biosynthesis